MKFRLTLLGLCLCNLLLALPIQDRSLNKKAVEELAECLGLDPQGNLIEQTQGEWLRKPTQERWDLQELSPEQREHVLYWAETQGLFAECFPSEENYDKALILGATTGCMRKRLDYLIGLWNLGVRFKEVVWLTGDRPLNPAVDAFLESCQNESEAALYLWAHAELPSGMESLPVLFVAVPMKQEGSSLKRPNTQDTLIAWLQCSAEPCKALFVSDQPFCGYQFAIINATLPDTISFEVVGPAVDPFKSPAAAAITLDSIARQLYAENLPYGVVLK